MLPSETDFNRMVGEELGLSNHDHIVVYDAQGVFRSFDFQVVIDGSLIDWLIARI